MSDRGQFYERIGNIRTNLKWACDNLRDLLQHCSAVESLPILQTLTKTAGALAKIEAFDRAVMADMVNANRATPTTAVTPDQPVSLGF